jgi:lipopolysaccharide/colanic/teichoic acid biosynthesis glycosyltransferase
MEKYPIYKTKRAFDMLFSFLVLITFSPIILLFLLGIIIEHIIRRRPFDPLLYSEIRYSQGEPFTLYKFNIFQHNVILEMRARGEFIHTKQLEQNGSTLYVGWILKQIYLDELPQFFNILKGDMSMVGPRPVNIEVFKKLLASGINDKAKVKAGLTGNYQSHKNTAGKKSDEMDREYVEYYRTHPWYKVLILDLKIMLRTIKVLLLARGV